MENKFTINEQKVLELFLTYPSNTFSTREIARLTKITHPTVATALQKIKKLKLVSIEQEINKSGIGNRTGWKANIEAEEYKKEKRIANLKSIFTSGLISDIDKQTAANAIVLFGSYARGEDTEESDIDLFVVSSEYKIDLRKYEKMLKKKINITFESNTNKMKKEFMNNVINGIVLSGYLEVIK